MRLINKIILIFLGVSFIVFLIGGMMTYQIIGNEIKKEEQWFLMERLRSTERFITKKQPKRPIIRDKVIILPHSKPIETDNIIFSDTIVYHSTLERPELHNKLEVGKKIEGRYYQITLYDIIIEQDDIIDGIVESLFKTYLILLALVLIMGWILSKKLLIPFERTLESIQGFDIKENEAIVLPKTGTKEFQRLNSFVENMSSKIRNDYQSLKEFSENASHEIQTPLSVAKGKLEILQDTQLDENQHLLVKEAQKSINNLSKLGNMLTLLAKIDNREFENMEEINCSNLLEDILEDYKELIHLKGLKLNVSIEDNVVIVTNTVLFEILVNNLLKNAVKHNLVSQGYISISLNNELMEIKNSGIPLKTDPDKLFDRFKKGNNKTNSLGLGLSIIRKICQVSNMGVEYKCLEEEHILRINFR
ncbi:HAMP domain-containing histidine kinase [Marivirga sp. S37H4]|uniref:histidine kinase n=1 Tax=Marivirga aurantiaca TaxID=2802615 RepID=A0A934WWL4_9BACT|nr:HAMP domain-containing sensor histidine kinase [Marivirga aurantiaca]MBK6264334.1 HAMP domain-containing histidine kinase [Marivirga aurantiaca]